MRKFYRVDWAVILIFLILAHNELVAQEPVNAHFDWILVDNGLSYCETDAPEKSTVNNSKLTLVRIDPSFYDFNLLTATEYGGKLRTAEEWANEFDMAVVFNAGMYSTKKFNPNKGYLKNFEHFNNSNLSSYYNAMMVMHPIDSTMPSFKIIDMTCQPWDSVKDCYHSHCQGMRMLDCEGKAMAFSKNPTQSCSMILISTDTEGIIYIVFSRSPYTHLKMIDFLKTFPLNLKQTVYLEGGPETSLYIKTMKGSVLKYGSYVSRTWANDENDHFWPIPNVIAIQKK
jgi:hypothetical protein